MSLGDAIGKNRQDFVNDHMQPLNQSSEHAQHTDKVFIIHGRNTNARLAIEHGARMIL